MPVESQAEAETMDCQESHARCLEVLIMIETVIDGVMDHDVEELR